MDKIDSYLFRSSRLGFRNWTPEDLAPMAAINADPAVMEYFPSVQTKEQTAAFIERMQQQLLKKGFCYYAVDTLEDEKFIGFIGLSEQTFETSFTPCIDIGWRLSTSVWNRGYATEGAKRCLEYAFDDLKLSDIKSMAPKINKRSENVMLKIGMRRVADFKHPLLHGNKRLEDCVLYEITR